MIFVRSNHSLEVYKICFFYYYYHVIKYSITTRGSTVFTFPSPLSYEIARTNFLFLNGQRFIIVLNSQKNNYLKMFTGVILKQNYRVFGKYST